MAILKDLAQVLHVYEQGNTSQVLVMLGRRLGQFRVYAKGARRWPKKGFEGGCDLLTRGEMLVYPRHGDALWVFKEWDERARPVVGRSVGILRAASYLCELTEALTRPTAGSRLDEFPVGRSSGSPRSDSPAALYDLLAASADALAAGARPGSLLLSFTLHALRTEGLLPDLTVCTDCGTKLLQARSGRGQASAAPQAVWLTASGPHCRACVAAAQAKGAPVERGEWLAPEAHRVLLHVLATARPVSVSQIAARQLARVLIVLVHGALEHDLRTLASAARMVAALGLGVPRALARAPGRNPGAGAPRRGETPL
jgi:recombinational DNA repair protein (RecF pathway)